MIGRRALFTLAAGAAMAPGAVASPALKPAAVSVFPGAMTYIADQDVISWSRPWFRLDELERVRERIAAQFFDDLFKQLPTPAPQTSEAA